jgi:ABC-2 type transport system ATP-binding protein
VTIIATEHLSKWYGQVSGLNDVTVAVPSGITGLLGPNGAGKSTFMKVVTGQLKPSKGSVRVLGETIWGNPGLYKRLGFCPEQDAFYERMTGLDWVTALVRLNGLSAAAAAETAHHALERVGLLDAAGKKIGAYSKGMRQRVKLAQAIALDPELLILDEPLNGMDPIMRRTTIELIRSWARAGRSVLVSSHVLHEIEALTDRRRRQRVPNPRSHRRASTHGSRPREGAPYARSSARVGRGRGQRQVRARCRRDRNREA